MFQNDSIKDVVGFKLANENGPSLGQQEPVALDSFRSILKRNNVSVRRIDDRNFVRVMNYGHFMHLSQLPDEEISKILVHKKIRFNLDLSSNTTAAPDDSNSSQTLEANKAKAQF